VHASNSQKAIKDRCYNWIPKQYYKIYGGLPLSVKNGIPPYLYFQCHKRQHEADYLAQWFQIVEFLLKFILEHYVGFLCMNYVAYTVV
jgi:hypothetical protein